MDKSTRWQISGQQKLLWQTWDNETVVFHTGSGDTHLLNPFTCELLKLLEKNALSLTELTVALVEHETQDENMDMIRHLDATLHELGYLGLIEREDR